MLIVCLKVRFQSYIGHTKALVIRNCGAKVRHLESQHKATLPRDYSQEQSGAYRQDDPIRKKIIEASAVATLQHNVGLPYPR